MCHTHPVGFIYITLATDWVSTTVNKLKFLLRNYKYIYCHFYIKFYIIILYKYVVFVVFLVINKYLINI